jgi:penicillin amidase
MARASHIIRNIARVVFVLLVAAFIVGWWGLRRMLPVLDGEIPVVGLKDGVTIDRDAWGRPWIRANSTEDLVMAQGYVMAQDRLWQMDLLRRVASGELSEIFGAVALNLDKENRTLGMRGAAERAVADSTPEIRGLLESYARGVNQYIETRGNKLPIEFVALGYRPRAWTPADTYLISLYMYKTLTSTWKSKLNRQWITEKVGPERAKDLFAPDSPLDHYIVGGLASEASPDAPAKRGSARESRNSTSLASRKPSDLPPFGQLAWNGARDFLAQFEEESSEIIGSNNFVVSGAHTASGKPLLANDTHLGLGVPCIWYLIHLTAPGWNVEGFALPGAPLVIIGHNDRIAWGFTNSNADVQDLYVETFAPATAQEQALVYRANGNWIPAQVRHETIRVRGQADERLVVIVTRHGPIIHRDPESEGGHAYALRWTALEPGGLDFGFPLYGRAQNWKEFLEVTRHIAGPGQNSIYADVDGNIGFTIPARIPIRSHGNGALPVSGDTDEHEWTGYIPFEDLPRAFNPPDGIIATANARTVGPDYKYFIADRWAGPYRTERIYELLKGRTGLRPEDCNSIQNDIVSLPNHFLATQLVAAARVNSPKDTRTQGLVRRLEGWDAQATADSVATAFIEYARHALFHHLLEPVLGDRVTKYELWEPESVYEDVWWRGKGFLEHVLRERPTEWLPSGFTSYDELLTTSADEAVARLEAVTGSKDETVWNWGRLHTLDIPHPLGRRGSMHRLLSIGPQEQGGTIDTVRALGVGHGPAMRFVADLSNFDNSLMEITTGESGQYASPYYRDEFPEWFAGRGFPAPFSVAVKEKSRVHRLILAPAAGGPSPSP